MKNDTTIDAAEVRALTVIQADRDAARALYVRDHVIDGHDPFLSGDSDGHPLTQAFARHRLATAEAASGAGEREAIRRAYISGCEQGWELPRDEGPTDAAERYAAGYVASLPPATDPAMVERFAKALGLHRYPGGDSRKNPPTRWPTGPRDTLSGRDGTVPLAWDFAEKCRVDARVMLAALAAAPTIPATGEAIRAVTAEMRRFMPTACGDWADKIDDALAEEKGRKVAFYDEGGIDIRPGESLADRDRRIYQQGRHDALNDEPEAFI